MKEEMSTSSTYISEVFKMGTGILKRFDSSKGYSFIVNHDDYVVFPSFDVLHSLISYFL